MKRYILAAFLAFGLAAHAQSVPANLTTAVKDAPLAGLQPQHDFSFYSKNYTRLFGSYQYTLDSYAFGERNVYVGSNSRFFFNGAPVMEAYPPNPLEGYYCNRHGDVVALFTGLVLLFNSDVDYSRDPSLEFTISK